MLAETVLNVDKVAKKMKKLTGHLAETANLGPDAMALVNTQKKNVA